jgi:hypothetical protein
MAAGDIACSPGDTSFNGGSGTASACQQLATASELHGVTAVLPLGDEQYEDGTLSAFQQAYDPSWGAMKAISYPVPGNHEYNTGSATGYFSYFGAAAGNSNQGYYSYNLGTWHLIALNSECSYIGGCAAGSAEETWLQSDLAVHTNVCTLAYWHEPLFTTGSVGPNTDMQTIWQDLYNAGVDVVLSGHAHDYEQFAPQTATGAYDPNRGIREFVVGTGGRNHLAFDPSASLGNTVVRDNTTFGVLKLVLHPASYDWQFMPDTQSGNGTFTDSGSAACH